MPVKSLQVFDGFRKDAIGLRPKLSKCSDILLQQNSFSSVQIQSIKHKFSSKVEVQKTILLKVQIQLHN